MLEFPWRRPIPQSSGGGDQTTTSATVLPDWLQDAAKYELNNAQDIATRDYQANPNQTVTPLTADQTNAYQTIRDIQGGTAPAYDASKTYLTGLLGGGQPLTAANVGADATSLMSPYTDQVVDPAVALMRQQLGITKQGIAANAANVGAFGGSRQGVQEGIADSQAALQAGQLKGGLLQSGWTTALGTAQGIDTTAATQRLQAAGLLPNIASAGQAQTERDAALLEGAGRVEQSQQQAEANLKAQQWQDEFDWPLTGQAILQSALSATPYGSTTSVTGPGTSKNMAIGALGGAASGAAIGALVAPGVGAVPGAVIGGLAGAFA